MTLYLDYNATAPMPGIVMDAVMNAVRNGGNPSSIHGPGRNARALVEDARENIANLLQTRPADIIFTSGGTEANALALAQAVHAGCTRVLVSSVEHPSVLEAATGLPVAVRRLAVDSEGRLDLDALTHALEEAGGRVFLSLMAANNETGVCQPIAEAASIVRAHGGIVHCDGVQWAGRMPLNIQETGVHMTSLSAHKMGGPAGVGALVVCDDRGEKITPLLWGGGQERGHRAGTENLSGIAGFGAVACLAPARFKAFSSLGPMRDYLESRLEALSAIIFGAGAGRLPNTSCFAVPGMTAQTLVMALDLEGIAVSAGAACSSGKVARSHVLDSMGVTPELAEGAIRVSLGWETAEADMDRFLEALNHIVRRRERPSVVSMAAPVVTSVSANLSAVSMEA